MGELDRKTIIITGGTSGIGLSAAVALARKGADLVLVGRNPVRGKAALEAVARESGGGTAQFLKADLLRRDEIRRLADTLSALPRIDVLLNNAGAIFRRRAVTADGLERTFALNHVAYFTLTCLLRERLEGSAPGRVVNVASEAHRGATLDFSDLQNEPYSWWRAYQRSKLCNILFTRELARRLAGTGVTANCLHPGFVATRIADDNGGVLGLATRAAKRLFALSPEAGAATPVHLAVSPDLAAISGGYFISCAPAVPSAAAQDDEAARRLWDVSMRLAGLDG
jgi:NAD(P)-dependent dehydrogenase (short-subunit alcohol dehydrogenase family)